MSQADLGAIERTRGGKRGVVTRRATTWPATGWLKEEKSEKDSRCEREKKQEEAVCKARETGGGEGGA